MNARDFDFHIASLGFDQGQAADFLGVTLRTVHNWVHGERPVPKAVAMLLRLMIKYRLKPGDVK